ncbi:MAG: hypothetical protein NTY19_38015 [Planctomycetota bacterium]|nr:hypothetical protein [Planctomycetota bacterium]
MPRTPELEQQLWELVYELLPEQEAAALRQRISSDPEVARAYAEVKLQTEILAQAAKPNLPIPVLQRPVSDGDSSRTETTTPAASPPPSAWSTTARTVNWLLGLAATLLVGLLGYSFIEPRFPFAPTTASQIASVDGQVRTTVFGPARGHSNQAIDLTVLTQSGNGQPRSEQMRYQFYMGNAQDPAVDKSAATDDAGLLQIKLPVLPVSSSIRLELTSRGDLATPPLRANLVFDADPLTTVLTLDRASYQPGDQVWYRSLTLSPFADVLSSEVAVEFSMRDPRDVQIPGAEHCAVSEQGVADGQLQVPADSSAGPDAVVTDQYVLVAHSPSRQYPEARLRFRVGETRELEERITEAIPIESGRIAVEFYPESGSLVSGVLNRVYFSARNVDGEAASIQGRVVDRGGKLVVPVQNGQAGRGMFQFTPLANESYRLECDVPADGSQKYPLPSASVERFVTLDAGAGVFDAGHSLNLELRSTQCTRPLAMVTRCRGATVGQLLVSRKSFPNARDEVGVCRLDLPLDERADGVIRVTLYDLNARPPQPVAERLVFRRPARKLIIQVAPRDSAASSDGEVELAVAVCDEHQRPQAATLGISVVPVDEADQTADRLPSLTTQYWLTSSLDGASIPNADNYLQENPEAAVDLDLLLGTQRPLWLVAIPPGQLAQSGPDAAYEGRLGPTLSATLDSEAAGLACLAEQLSKVASPSTREVAAARADRELRREQLGRTLFFSSLVVLIGLVAVGLSRMSAGVKVWVPVLSTATVCLLVAWLWIGRPGGSLTELAKRRATPIDGEIQLAEAEFSKPVNDIAASPPVELQTQPDAAADGSRLAVNAKQSAPQPLRHSSTDKSASSPSVAKTADSYAMPEPSSRADDVMSAGLPAQPQIGRAELDATPPPTALKALPDAAAPAAEPVPAPAPAVAASAPPAMPAAPAPEAASITATGPRLESAEAAKDELSATAPQRLGLKSKEAVLAKKPSPATEGLAASDLFGKPDSTAEGTDVARKGDAVRMRSEERPAEGPGVTFGGMAADSLGKSAEALHRDDAKLAEKEAVDKVLGGFGYKPSPGAGGLGGAFDFRAKNLADDRPLAAKEQAQDLAKERQDESPADTQERPSGLKRRTGTSEMGPGIDWVERSNEPLHWEPQLQTDAEGRVSIRFSLPSHVSACRVSIDAHANGRIGHVQESFHFRSR